MIFTSGDFHAPGASGINGFGGLVSTVAFDRVVISDPIDNSVFLDNIYFGPPIPTPAALPLVAMVGLLGRRRR